MNSRHRLSHRTCFAALLIAAQVFFTGSAVADTGNDRLAALFGGPWSLTDVKGQAVSEKTWLGQVVVLYFGYLSCPDICPTSLQTIAQALDALGTTAAKVQPLFVTVDPERDTSMRLADFTAQFHPRIIGLTGTPDQIASMTKAFRVSYRKVPDSSGKSYFIDHSSVVYLIDTGGKTAAVLGPETSADAMAAALGKLLPASTN